MQNGRKLNETLYSIHLKIASETDGYVLSECIYIKYLGTLKFR